MPVGHVLAHRARGGFVVADRAHHSAPGTPEGELRQDEDDHENDRKEHRIAELDPERRRGCRVEPDAARALDETGIRLQVDLVGDRTRQAVDVLDAAGHPILVLQDRDDDLCDAERCDGEVVGPKAKRRLADDPGRARSQKPADGPGQKDRQTQPAKISRCRGIDRLHRFHAGIEDGPEGEEPDEEHRRDGPAANPARSLLPDEDRSDD